MAPPPNPNSNNNTPSPRALNRASPFVKRPLPFIGIPKNRNGSPFMTNRNLSNPLLTKRKPLPPKPSAPKPPVLVKNEESNDTNLGQFNEYKIFACTKEDIENVQYHLMKFRFRNEINPGKDFSQPIRLHRKDPKNLQFQLTLKEIEEREKINKELQGDNFDNKSSATINLDDLEAEAEAAETEVGTVAPEPQNDNNNHSNYNNNNIAPDGSKGRGKKMRKTKEARKLDEDARKLRYEEFYPWVMEDYDGKNIFVGNYEAATTIGHNHALLIPSNGGFKMIPINKIYKFTPRNRYPTLTSDEANERIINGDRSVPRWLMEKIDDGDDDELGSSNSSKKLARKKRFKTVDDDDLFGDDDDEKKHYSDDGFDYDEEFADDEEAPIVGDNDNEEEKDSRKRMEKEMLQANTGLEDRVDNDEKNMFSDEENKKRFDKEGKKMKKTLVKNEFGQIIYDSEDEENPYVSESDLETDSENEIKKEGADENDTNNDTNNIKSSPSPTPQIPRISIKLPVNNPIGKITIIADKAVLLQFPQGDWNPKKRKLEISSSIDKKTIKKSKVSNPELSISLDPNDPTILTQNEMVDLIKNNKFTAKALFNKLKSRVSQNKANKEIFKKLLVNVAKAKKDENGERILSLKNPNL